MSTKWSGYFKIITPKQDTQIMYDSEDLTGSGLYGNYSWYAKFVNGSNNRLQRYKEYEIMDNDVEVSLALDTIAEHMSEKNIKTDLPFDLDIKKDENKTISNTIIVTLITALRHWNSIHEWDTKIFNISRNLSIYGDVFFEKESDFKPWKYINANKIIGAVVNSKNKSEILGWQKKEDDSLDFNSKGIYDKQKENNNVNILLNEKTVRFTLNDDMSESAPFGESILKSVVKSHRQKMMLEDAILIYRIVRAPERRAFYVDVGKLPPNKVNALLVKYKDEIRQKKIPTSQGGKDSIDSVYNIQSMSEDFFFASRDGGKGSRIESLPGGANLGSLEDLEHFQNKVWRGLRVPLNWMQPSSDSLFNDDRVGTAYIEEIRFSKFIDRLQGHIEKVLDKEFKSYLKKCNITIDEYIFKLKLPKPTNFASYRQQQLDSELLNSMINGNSIDYLSRRYLLQRYGQFNDDDILINERLKMEELGIDPNNPPTDYLKQIYSNSTNTDMGLGLTDSIGGLSDNNLDVDQNNQDNKQSMVSKKQTNDI